MRAPLATIAAVLLLAAPASAQVGPGSGSGSPSQGGRTTGDTGPLRWPDEVPPGSPFAPSADFSGITFTGPWVNYEGPSDTYYPSWGADGRLYSPFMDGSCGGMGSFGGSPADRRRGGPLSELAPTSTVMGTAVATGETADGLALRCATIQDEHKGWDGRYASASLNLDGVWYYGSYLLNRFGPDGVADCGNYCELGPFVGWHVSTDGGRTWRRGPHTADDPLFGESIAGGARIRLGALHVVDFGRNMEHSPDGYAYLVGHGGTDPKGQNTWVNGDDVYLVRTRPSPETINDRSAYEYWTGTGWSRALADLRPLLSWPGHLGSATITYDAPLRRYLMFMSRPSDGVDTTAAYDTIVMEASELTGPYRMVHWLPRFGTQAYFVNAPSKFISADGRSMWLSYSGNYNNSSGAEDPPGSTYSWVMRRFELDRAGAPPPPAAAPGARDCRDARRPTSRIARVRLRRRSLLVSGRARDAGCAGVARVRVTVARREGGRRCRFLGAGGRLGRVRACRRAVAQTARGTGVWAFNRPVRLPRGRYVVRARAVDAAGHAERALRRRGRRLVRLR
ncbi:MAG TPA: DUF4185 domain-containing protein [Solirubrobacteraceae bacterium]